MGKKPTDAREFLCLMTGRLRAIRTTPEVFGWETPPGWLENELALMEREFRRFLNLPDPSPETETEENDND